MEYHEDVRYLCKNCNAIHHPSERDESTFGSSCPECDGFRRLIIHDKDGYVNYCEIIASWN